MPRIPDRSKFDSAIAARVRHARQYSGMSQTALATKLGISHQQLSKYETGETIITASCLWQIAKALDVPMMDFFRKLERDI